MEHVVRWPPEPYRPLPARCPQAPMQFGSHAQQGETDAPRLPCSLVATRSKERQTPQSWGRG